MTRPLDSDSVAPPSAFRGFIQGKTRITMAWVFAFLLILSAREYPTWPGILVCFIGATIRFWASGYLRKDTRPAVGGPYARMRNPLYFGTYLMAVGTAFAVHAWLLLLAMSVLFAVVYHYIILDEEAKLEKIFGNSYLHYCKEVPRFFPSFFSASKEELSQINPDETHHRFSWELAQKNKAFEAYYTFAAMIGAAALIAYGWNHF